jgi:alkanesulfonate monooxygenase SsuD/methylene tetrahydromethanopterin reductase-like flavin-dependent oxidoreductase (luciferase family)
MGVRFGLVYDFRNPNGLGGRYSDWCRTVLEHIRAVEEMGYHAVFVAEHHFSDDGYMPAPLTAAAAIAAVTKRIRVGTWIVILPLHHPVEVAEQAAVVDNLSGGRLELGLGLGYAITDFDGYGISRAERRGRMDEGVEIVVRALKGEKFSFAGRYFNLSNVQVSPPPVQQPMPIWLAARSPAAAQRAARHGLNLMMFGGSEIYSAYSQALQTVGRSSDGQTHQVATLLSFLPWFVCQDPDKTWERIKGGFRYMATRYCEWFGVAADLPQDKTLLVLKDWSADEFKNAGLATVGTPEQVRETITSALASVPYSLLVTWGIIPGTDPEMNLESHALFAEKVMPYFT